MKIPHLPPETPRPILGARYAHGFTLLELLLVLAIIGVVIGLAAPLAGGLGKSKSVTEAGNHLTDLLASARQNSMTKNCLTVLLIPAGTDQWNSCILYQLRPKPDGTAPTSSDWEAVSKWENLPTGVTIDDTTFVTEAQSASLPAPLPTIRRGNTTISEYRFVTFMPRGILYPKTVPSGGNPYLNLVAGIRSGRRVILQGSAKNGMAANIYKIIVLSSTGITKIERS
jgi:prepilin-type N-terminal cleavage/methylation domain-containing protein